MVLDSCQIYGAESSTVGADQQHALAGGCGAPAMMSTTSPGSDETSSSTEPQVATVSSHPNGNTSNNAGSRQYHHARTNHPPVKNHGKNDTKWRHNNNSKNRSWKMNDEDSKWPRSNHQQSYYSKKYNEEESNFQNNNNDDHDYYQQRRNSSRKDDESSDGRGPYNHHSNHKFNPRNRSKNNNSTNGGGYYGGFNNPNRFYSDNAWGTSKQHGWSKSKNDWNQTYQQSEVNGARRDTPIAFFQKGTAVSSGGWQGGKGNNNHQHHGQNNRVGNYHGGNNKRWENSEPFSSHHQHQQSGKRRSKDITKHRQQRSSLQHHDEKFFTENENSNSSFARKRQSSRDARTSPSEEASSKRLKRARSHGHNTYRPTSSSIHSRVNNSTNEQGFFDSRRRSKSANDRTVVTANSLPPKLIWTKGETYFRPEEDSVQNKNKAFDELSPGVEERGAGSEQQVHIGDNVDPFAKLSEEAVAEEQLKPTSEAENMFWSTCYNGESFAPHQRENRVYCGRQRKHVNVPADSTFRLSQDPVRLYYASGKEFSNAAGFRRPTPEVGAGVLLSFLEGRSDKVHVLPPITSD